MSLNGEKPAKLDSAMLDDFFAEAGEHLLNIRQALLQVGAAHGQTRPNPKVMRVRLVPVAEKRKAAMPRLRFLSELN